MRKSFLEKLKNWFYDLPLSRKLMFSFSLFTLVPITLFFVFFYSDISGSERERAENAARQALDQAVSFIDFKVNNLNNILNLVSIDTRLNDIVIKNSSGGKQEIREELDDFEYLNKLINKIKLQNGTGSPVLYFRNTTLYTNVDSEFISIDDVQHTDWYRASYANHGKIIWFPGDYFENEKKLVKTPLRRTQPESTISAVKAIKNSNNLNEFIGFIRYEIPEKEINTILSNAKTGKTQKIFIVNGENTIVSAYGITPDQAKGITASIGNVLSAHMESYWSPIKLDNQNVILGIRKISGTDWKLVSIFPYSDLLLIANSMRFKIVLFYVCLLLSIYIMAFFISFVNTRRLKKFVVLMESAKNGNFDVGVLPKNNDEIGILAKNFNSMLTKIAILMDEQYKMGLEVKNAELKALQAQINPHFLYNTLDLINWFSALGKVDELRDTVYSLSTFYKLTLSRGEAIIPLRDEIEHVKAYAEIQNKRFDGFLKLDIDVKEEYLDCPVPKVTLQPLVENSIIHGILEKEDPKGTVLIKAENKGDNIFLSVIDDGIGMDAGLLKKLEAGEVKSKGNSYGIKNINERLKILYGYQNGLSFSSSPGEGTAASIVIPLGKTIQ